MSDREQIALQERKLARDSGATATSVALVLFAALIVSFLGMWEQVGPYRSALASQQWFMRHQKIAGASYKRRIGQEVKGILTRDALSVELPRTEKSVSPDKLKELLDRRDKFLK